MARAVSKQVLQGLVAVVDAVDVDRRAVLGDLLGPSGELPESVEFAAILPAYARLPSLLPAELPIDQVGKVIFELPGTFHPMRALGLFMDARQLVESSVAHIRRFFPNIEGRVRPRPDGTLEVEYRVDTDTDVPRAFFDFQAGVLAGLPRLLGLPLARVQTFARARASTYVVELPPSRTLWARLRSAVWVVRNGQSALRTLADQAEALRDKNDALLRALAEARQNLEAREQFIASISHELRTPLNGLLSSLETLDQEVPAELRAPAATATRSAARLHTKIESLVHYTEIAANSLRLAPRVVRVEALADRIARRATAILGPTVDLAVERDAALPACLEIDAERFEHLLAVLIDNVAAHASATRSTVAIRRAPNGVALHVIDDGIGMSAEGHYAPFDTFGHSPSRRANQGLGLGLTVARALCHCQGGQLSFATGPGGRGTAVVASIPAKGVAEVSRPPGQLLRRVLLVDDDAINLLVTTRMLVRLGVEVITAKDGHAAVEIGLREEVDLILMDCEMPGMDGPEAAARLVELRPDGPPIVAYTAFSSASVRERCTGAGMVGMLTKPIDPPRLREYLTEELGFWLPEPPASLGARGAGRRTNGS